MLRSSLTAVRSRAANPGDRQTASEELEAEGITARISGRPKHIYSIYNKMVRKEKPFEMLMDLRGVRLIVKDIATCYRALASCI